MSSKSTAKTAPTTLALIPYLNCEPFYGRLTGLDFDVVHEVPRELGKLASSGMATCGPMAVADWFQLRDRFDLLGDFGIACEGPAHSVLFFAKKQIRDLDGARIGLTTESSTSVKLLELILKERYHLEDVVLERSETDEDDGRLLIGDQALVAASEGYGDYPFVYDLGEEWLGWQALPFVFARWVVSKEVPQADRELIESAIAASLDGWKLRIPEIAARRGREFGLDGEGVLSYLSTFRYRIGAVESLGEQSFESMLKELD